MTPSLIVAHIDANPSARGILGQDVLEQMAKAEIDSLKHQFVRDAEIDATQMETRRSGTESAQPPTAENTYDVFVSFASVDRKTAEDVANRLEEQKLKVFFSPKELQGGDPWEEVIRLALIGSGELCLIVSKESITREWVLTEWEAAWATGKRITPVLVDVEIGDLPRRLQPKQCIRLSDLETYALNAAERQLGKRSSSTD